MGRMWIVMALAAATSWAWGQGPTSDDLQRLVAEKNYSRALQKITAGLALKGPAARTVNRYELYLLKGECHLQMRAMSHAAEAYAAAAKEPTASPPERAVAAAHEMLVKQAKGLAYTPKASPDKGRPAPIDISDKESRRRAFAALLADELAASEGKLANAKTSKALGAIAAMFKPLVTLEGIELAATGNGEAPKIKAIQADLAERAKRAVADALRGLSKRVGEVDKEANTYVETYIEKQDPYSRFPRIIREKVYKKRGLSDAHTKELQETNATCDKIPLAMAEMAEGLRAPEKEFEPFTAEAGRIRKEVDRLLDTDYQRVYREIPRK
jgi:hypothetical protein